MTANKNDARRAFLTRLGAGALVAGVSGQAVNAQAVTGARGWEPARHPQDDWLDRIPGVHRFIIDTTNAAGFDSALLFVANYFAANRNEYGLKDSDLAVVIVARHDSTAFAYTDAMWEKYGAALTRRSGFLDKTTQRAPIVNVYGGRLNSLLKQGVHLAVCQMATRFYANTIAEPNRSDGDRIFNELRSNLMPNAHLVPAGIVAVNRAQERGYSFAHAI